MSEEQNVSNDLMDLETTFDQMGLDSRILRALKKMGFKNPSLVQSKAIPLSLQGKDILAKARTGSGKTAAYSIPIIQKILTAKEKTNIKGVKAVILVPTRELCEQVKQHFTQLSCYSSHLVSVVQLGGDKSIDEQKGLLRDIPDVIISTPTRLVQHLQNKTIQLQSSLDILVIDEADLVLSYGHQEDINIIKSFLPKVCQCFLMSATLTQQVEELKKLVLHTPAILKLEEDKAIQTNLTEYSIKCAETDKFLLIFSLLRLRLMQGKILFFVNDTNNCYKLKLFFERFHIKCAVLNSELPINSRHNIILQFNKGIFDYLIATDESFSSTTSTLKEEELEDKDEEEMEDSIDGEEEDIENLIKKNITKSNKSNKSDPKVDKEYGVARGIDFKNVDIVVNFDFPRTIKNYIHRIGRTARGTNKGIALSFVTFNNENLLSKVQKTRGEAGYNLKPFEFKMNAIEGFRYRVEDVLRNVNVRSIKEARKSELKQEVLNNEKLKSHFSENPQDLLALKHDTALIKKQVSNHLKYVPEYLLPQQFKSHVDQKLEVIPSTNNPEKVRGVNYSKKTEQRRRKKDILKTLSMKAGSTLTGEELAQARSKSLIKRLKIKEDNISADGTFKTVKVKKTHKKNKSGFVH
ncbi:hypothetical protein DICPUDRAFT_32400 [Dictyostelium purpureum]|uniref:RNA helicase n=1 Tax=Dictyostelium purpureum TaxID=5786 RepID=F0ZIZ5_DICPU|nr:uncharacterized protein DICPUDRAFT_32400 [Dictyostelium purpureum]EGC36067.1 hypothetical protein DICPUDRAFT_32400 [Dictyostelium purpureum]|eukprot:XP_003287385.1 hypothetical protein DICPUDRAFT_32400 [Dictyostelium purpureum]